MMHYFGRIATHPHLESPPSLARLAATARQSGTLVMIP